MMVVMVVMVKVLSVCDVVERERECVLRQLECHITGSGWSILVLTVTSGASVARENTKHNNSQGLLGPAGTCCLLSSHDLPCCPGRRGGGRAGCPLKILSGGGGGGGMWPLNLLSTIWTLDGHNGLLHCDSSSIVPVISIKHSNYQQEN